MDAEDGTVCWRPVPEAARYEAAVTDSSGATVRELSFAADTLFVGFSSLFRGGGVYTVSVTAFADAASIASASVTVEYRTVLAPPSDGALTEIPLCVEENGRLYTAQAYLNDPYRSVDEQGVKLDYVSDGRIEFTVPVTLQSGKTVTAQYAAVADGGRWVLETLFAADESR